MSTPQRELRIWPIAAGILAVGLLLLAASDFVRAWVHDQVRQEQLHKVVDAASPVLDDYHRQQQELLGEYAWVDRDSSVVRLPIERAMELVAKEEGGAR